MATILRDRSAKLLRVTEFAFGHTVPIERRGLAPADEAETPRTCRWCGAHVPFRLDPVGGWAECTVCDRLN
jgi:hypothetical protein